VIVSIVRFKSKLTANDVQASSERRADRYRKVPGLAERIYVRFRDTGEFGALYVWDSEEAMAVSGNGPRSHDPGRVGAS
jgi:hypothetical protein